LHRKPKSISSFIAGYKSSVINKIDDYIDDFEKTHGHASMQKYNRLNPLWQPNYYDHIIRTNDSYIRIKDYIIDNPKNWNTDKFNTNKTM